MVGKGTHEREIARQDGVVTGGSSGIGYAVAQTFVDEGAHVFIVGRRQSELDKVGAALGPNVTTVQGDVSNLDDLDRLYATVGDAKGKLDIVVASAGIVEFAAATDVTPAHFDKIFDINARGTFFSVQKALPLMNDHGSIVILSSGTHLKGLHGYCVYAATKAALRSFVRTLAFELKDRGIRVNCISPGLIETPMAQIGEANRKAFEDMTPLGRLGRPTEIAASILFLASDDSGYCTGIDLVADGGGSQV